MRKKSKKIHFLLAFFLFSAMLLSVTRDALLGSRIAQW